jgi:hypothetical protein
LTNKTDTPVINWIDQFQSGMAIGRYLYGDRPYGRRGPLRVRNVKKAADCFPYVQKKMAIEKNFQMEEQGDGHEVA